MKRTFQGPWPDPKNEKLPHNVTERRYADPDQPDRITGSVIHRFRTEEEATDFISRELTEEVTA